MCTLCKLLVQLPGFARVRPPPLITHPHHSQTQTNQRAKKKKKIKKIHKNISKNILKKIQKKIQKKSF
jgi:hypothetical protein